MMGLDDQQRQAFQEALQKNNEKLRSLETKLRTAQKEVLTATLAEKYDEKTVRDKVEAAAKIQSEITLLRAAALATVAPTLKPDQKQQILESPGGALLLNAGFPGGPGGPRGGGPGGFPGGGRGGDQPPRER